jgi:hypothetical protein
MPAPIPALSGGVFARYVDANNHVRAALRLTSGAAVTHRCEIIKRVAGVETILRQIDTTAGRGVYVTVTLIVTASGRWIATARTQGAQWQASGNDSDLATGGPLASGRIGLYDFQPGSTSSERSYDAFQAWTPTLDAAVFANRQLDWRHDGVVRQDPAGQVTAPVAQYEGDYLLIPPAGDEARSVRYIVKTARDNPATGTDPAIDDVTAQLTVTPRGLVVPSS